ncbi:MAG TPA: alpha/beta hydrolase [Candidatus Binatia bacterium]|nr:alpha/beta hydrolase [Candidatus Binatia bacterium]
MLLALEGRAWIELASLVPALPILRGATPTGDGHPVVVLPGYLATDASTVPLRWFLRDRGYPVCGWGLGRNFGPGDRVVKGLARLLDDVCDRHGAKASLVGWSLGGIFARELARRRPEDVRQVITLASPFRSLHASNVPRLPRSGPPPALGEASEIERRLGEPLPVPTTAIWSRSDGIVAGRSCVEHAGPQRESIEVETSHCGMGFHPAALLVIGDRLAQPEGEWRPFDCSRLARWPFRGWPRKRTRPPAT